MCALPLIKPAPPRGLVDIGAFAATATGCRLITGMAAVLHYPSEVSGILGGVAVLSTACTPARKRIQEHRRYGYRPRHARPRRFLARSGRRS